jgi:hypothetical protein
MSLFAQFETDKQKEKEGVLITYAPNADETVPGFRILRRGASNQRYTKSLEVESGPFRRLLDLGVLEQSKQERILRRVFCSSVLIGWEHIQDEAGNEIPFSFDNAMKLLERLPDLYYDLAEQAGKVSSFRLESQGGDTKN